MIKDTIARWERRFIRNKLSKSTPESLLKMGEKYLLPAFRRAATRSPAYRALLAEAKVDPASVRSVADFKAKCPLLEKSNTFKRFEIAQLMCDDVAPDDLASVLTSSGHGAGGFALGMSTRKQHHGSARLIDIGLEMAFSIDSRRTLLINCLPMGVMFNSDAVCVANVSVREDMACAIVKQSGSLFEQIILVGDPLFYKRFCDYSEQVGVDWSKHRVNAIIGEETFPEAFRTYLAGVLKVDVDDPAGGLIGSSMGVGELGLNLFSETRETVALRRACVRDPALLKRLTGVDASKAPVPTFMTFNPLRTIVEVINTDTDGVGDLVVTMTDETAPVPLMRYNTGDRMQLLTPGQFAAVREQLPPGWRPPPAPMVALHGRAKDRLPGGGHVDLFKETLYSDPAVAKPLSGAHRIHLADNGIRWEVQAVRGAGNLDALSARLKGMLAPRLAGAACDVVVLDYDSFPHGKTVDYERKFVYWVPPV